MPIATASLPARQRVFEAMREAPRMLAQMVLASAYLSTWFYVSGDWGPIDEKPRRFVGAAVLAVAALVAAIRRQREAEEPPAAPSRLRALTQLAIPALLTLGLGAVILVADFASARIALAGGLALLAGGAAIGAPLVLAAMVAFATQRAPELAAPGEWLASALRRLGGPSMQLVGPTPLAIGPLATAALVVVLSGVQRRRPLVTLAVLAALAPLELLHLRGFGSAPANSPDAAMAAVAALPHACLGFAAVASLATVGAGPGGPRRPLPIGWLRGAAGAGMVMALAMSWPSLFHRHGSRVLILNEGGLDWNRPRLGKYGSFEGGMFGLLPSYLRADGYTVDVLPPQTIAAPALASTDIFILINSPKKWTPAERAEVQKFLRQGKSVLVLGDHTDVFGLQTGFNTLLPEYGIEFPFDAAYPLRPGFAGCAAVASHPATLWAHPSFSLEHGIGASLSCDASVPKLAWAPYAFSDHGIRENVMGSYLGNYAYGPGERMGDLTLVAWRDVGRGKLVVYGDTSAFQNSGISEAYGRHVLPLFEWLGRPAGWPERQIGRRATAALLILFALVALLRHRRCAAVYGVAVAGTCLLLELVARAGAPRPRIDHDAVVMDQSLMPLTGHYNAKMNSLGPLYSELKRHGLRVYDEYGLDDRALMQARALVLIAPTTTVPSPVVRRLLEYQEQGGVVLLAVGGAEAAASGPLLHAEGLDLAPTALGTVPSEMEAPAEAREPRLGDAWPIVSWPDGGPIAGKRDSQVLFSWGDKVLAVEIPRGKGGFILVADSRFFSSQNVEDEAGHWPGNILFIDEIFRRFLHTDPRAVQDEFVSPKMPR